VTQEVCDALHTSLQTLERTKRVHEAMTVNELLSLVDEIVKDDPNEEGILDQIAQAHADGDCNAESD